MEHPIFYKASSTVSNFLNQAIDKRGKRFSHRQVQYLVNRAKCEYTSVVGSEDGWKDVLNTTVKEWRSKLTIV